MYKLSILPSAERDCDKLRGDLFDRIRKKILLLEKEPRPHGAIKMTGEDGYRIRIGDYRVLYRIDEKGKTIYIYRVKHRKEVYR